MGKVTPDARTTANVRQYEQERETGAIQGSLKNVPVWTKGVCPNCYYLEAEVDPDGILWCPACGYSKKGCYT